MFYLKHVILVYQVFENYLKSQDYKRNLKVECVILPLVNANVLPVDNCLGHELQKLYTICNIAGDVVVDRGIHAPHGVLGKFHITCFS